MKNRDNCEFLRVRLNKVLLKEYREILGEQTLELFVSSLLGYIISSNELKETVIGRYLSMKREDDRRKEERYHKKVFSNGKGKGNGVRTRKISNKGVKN